MMPAIGPILIKAPISRFSSTVIEVKTLWVCGTKAMPLFTRSNGASAVISSPPIDILPPRRFNMPKMAFIAVDLPAPFGPTTTAISPRSTQIEQPFNIFALP